MSTRDDIMIKFVGYLSNLSISCCLIGVLCLLISLVRFEILFTIGWVFLACGLISSVLGVFIAFWSKVKISFKQKICLFLPMGIGCFLFLIILFGAIHIKFRLWYEDNYSMINSQDTVGIVIEPASRLAG